MRVLLVHNFYRQPGGEDYAFHAEAAVLARNGHEVKRFERASADATDSLSGLLRTAMATAWASETAAALESEIRAFRPDVVHFHNTFPLISPSAYYTCRRAGVPVVQTLHNYRLLCAKAELFRDGAVCEDCLHGSSFSALRHRCYRGSLPGTVAVAGMLSMHHAIGTWRHAVDRYVALTEFARAKFIEGGLPADRIVVKPNFLNDTPPVRTTDGDFALFVGRLTDEKGIATLMAAWESLAIPLRIVGSGPWESRLRAWASKRPHVHIEGWLAPEHVRRRLTSARFLVMPSLWYEGFPIALLEAMAAGVPVLASRQGSLAELADESRGCIPVDPGDAPALAAASLRLWQDAPLNRFLSSRARNAFEASYDAEAGYRRLLELYEGVVESRASRQPHPSSVWVENTPVADLDLPETVALIGAWLDGDVARRVATANLDFLRLAARDRQLARALRTADLVTADGTPLLWLARMQGDRLRSRVAGADLIVPLAEEARRRGRSIYLLGGMPGAAARVAGLLGERFRGLRIAGVAAPAVDLDDPESCAAAVRMVADARPDLLLVAFGCPKQDLFLMRYLEDLHCKVGIGVGASLDFLAGNVRRAPAALQRLGLEWAFRMLQEPRRLGSRYARDLAFLGRAAIRTRRAARRRSRTSGPQ
ncbi:MAG TPA: WecB/TagA/CpsF family glycosyltransferase [Candidatus Binatia bacterium]|nr:WecB/TagA/CpsF family glycosyltransferase [Candidatus Binatia bacterium]